MCGQMRSDAVSLTAHSALTSAYIHNQVRYSNVCSVRDEEATGSNPAATASQAATSAKEGRTYEASPGTGSWTR
jgi:hypothetical protein